MTSIFEYDEGKGSEELRDEFVHIKKKKNNTNKENIQIISELKRYRYSL